MSENEQDLRDEQDRRGYADVRPKEKQYREAPIKPTTTTTITHEPSPRYPVRLPSQQVPIDVDKSSIDNIPKKRSQEKQIQIKQQQQLRYQPDPIVENHHQSYPQPQPNHSQAYNNNNNNNNNNTHPPSSSVLKASASYGPIYAPSASSLAPPAAVPVQQQQQVPYPPRRPSYSASDETKPEPKQYSAYDMNILLDRMSRMENEIADLKAEVKELRREKDIMMVSKMQSSRSDVDYHQPMMRRRESMGRFPQDRHYYNKSADHHTTARYRSMDYIDDYPSHPRQELYYPYDSPSFYNNMTPPKDEIKPSRPHRRIRSRSFGNVQDPEFDYKYPLQYYSKHPSSHGYY